MNIIIKKLKNYYKGIRYTLVITFIMNLVCTAIFLMFAFGMKDITNETLSKDNIEQLATIISSVILVSILCICFLQWIIRIEIIALFEHRKYFNITMKLMGLSSKKLRGLYWGELLYIQLYSIPVGVMLIVSLYLMISKKLFTADNKIAISLLAIYIHVFCVFINVFLILRKQSSVEVTELLRGNPRKSIKPIGKMAIIQGFFGSVLIVITLFMDVCLNYNDLDILYIIDIVLIAKLFFYSISKVVLKISYKINLSYIAISERMQIATYKRVFPIIIMFGIGLMFFLGLQSLFLSARNYAKHIVSNNLNYSECVVYEQLFEEKKVLQSEADDILTALNYIFYVNESSYPKVLYGVDTKFLDFETMIIDKQLSQINLVEKLDDPNWNGIIVPNSMLGKENVGEKRILNINGVEIEFYIEGGYYPNVFHKNIWIVSKAYLQRQLNQSGLSNMILNKGNRSVSNMNYLRFNNCHVETKNQIAQKSENKVTNSTTTVEIISIIIVLCATVSMCSFLILNSKEYVRDIITFRSHGLGIKSICKLYIIQLSNILLKGFIMGMISAYLLAKTSLYAVLGDVNATITFPLILAIKTFIVIYFLTLVTFLICVKKGLGHDITLNLRIGNQ